eukprot:TRINITY_DN32526_c0_g1_i1.p1 TRINITY_DN32526_c0_g1~~TRINITY_DN32526_c0_g1_i1.p1  ORF type:complete len:787 (-),score=116.79 TRINITY_DN32526_c0_g1_i1:561-2921(-)
MAVPMHSNMAFKNMFGILGVPLAVLLTGGFQAWQQYENVVHMYAFLWPPSRQSAPALSTLVLCFVLCCWRTFFQSGHTDEAKRVQQEKKRLTLAQMSQALKWAEETPQNSEGEDTGRNSEHEKDHESKKRPPSSKDLYEMLFDDIEERHVTEYGIDPTCEIYMGVLQLFRERLPIDLQDAVKFTTLARSSLEDVDNTMSKDEMKRVAEFRDGTKLSELIDLYLNKICKHFGKNFVPKEVVAAVMKCRKELGKEQRSGARLLIPMIASLLPIYVVGLALMIFDSIVGAALWHSLSTVLDGVHAGTMTMEDLKWVTVRNQVKFVFCICAHLSSWAFTGKVTSQFRLKVRSEVMRSMVCQDTSFFDMYPSGVLQERLNNDAEMLASKLFEIPMRIVHNLCMLISNMYAVYALKPDLFYMIFLPLPFMSVAQYFIIKVMNRIGDRQRKIGEQCAVGTMEVLKEIRTVRKFAMETEEADKFAANSGYRASIEEYGSALHHIVFLSPLVCTMNAVRNTTTYLCGFYVVSRTLTVGQACQIAWAADHLQHCIRSIMFMAPDLVKILNPLGRVCDMLTSKPRIEPLPNSAPKLRPQRFSGRIQFINVDFTFPSEPNKQILSQLSFAVESGEKVAFVGSTGCGKSTSIKLIERFYEPNAGEILLDGRNIAEYDIHHLRQHMSVVAQENILFSTIIRENIIYGLPRERRETITDDEIEAACRKANAWTFIQDFPRKLETFAGERGVKLSGGQKQRLAIARAIIRKPTILLLDKATSALDSKVKAKTPSLCKSYRLA